MNFRILFVLIMIIQNVSAQRTFMKHFGTSGSEYGCAISLTDESGVLLCQTVQHPNYILIGLVRTDANGHKEWSKVYRARDYTVVKSIVSWKKGFVILATTWDSGSVNYKILLMRINSSGDMQWMREYSSSNADLASGLAIHQNKFYITAIADYNVGSVYPKLFWMVTDTAGIPIHSKMLAASYNLSPMSMDVNAAGKTGIACVSNSFGTGSFIFTNIVLIQLDSLGNTEWANSIGTYYDDEVNDIAADDSGWMMTGRSYFLNREYDLSLFRFDDSGNLVHGNFYDASTYEGEAGRSIISKSNHDAVIAGDGGTFDERNMFLFSADDQNDINWSEQYPVSTLFTNYPYDLLEIQNDSGYFFTGDLRPVNAFRNAALFRSDSVGKIGCLTQTISFTKYSDTLEFLNVTLADSVHTVTHAPLTWQDFNILLMENTLCSFPTADFSHVADTICPGQVCMYFHDESVNATSWQWSFPGGTPASATGQIPPAVCYSTPGTYQFTLTVNNGQNTDTRTENFVLPVFCDTNNKPVYIPNVISPNGDRFNDQFIIKNLPDNFHLYIYNRWGQLLFETKDKDINWPQRGSSSRPSDGVYYYVVETYPSSGVKLYHGTLLVMGN